MKLQKFILSLFCASMAVPSVAEVGDTISNFSESRLEGSLERLSTVREGIREEKVPLAREREKWFNEVQQVRRQAERAQRLSDNQSADVAAMEDDVELRRDEVDYLINLSGEFARSLEALLDPAEAKVYDELLSDALMAQEDPDMEPIDKMRIQVDVLEKGIERMETLTGGHRFEGQAVLPNGSVEDGAFVLSGPVSYFTSSESGQAGLVVRSQSLQPAVVAAAGGRFDDGIAALAREGRGVAPLDPTLGNALAIAATQASLIEHIQKGGIWIFPILFFAFMSFFLALFKAFEIFTLPTAKQGTLGEILGKLGGGEREEAAALANETPGPVGRMLQQGVKYSDHDPDLVDEILYETVVDTQPKVMRLLPFISVTAAVAPLLGLLGTVTGMINTFNRIQIFGTGDAKSLSGGISEALVTTEFGLIVAIPSLIFYAILSRKAKAYISNLEKTSIGFVNGLKAMKSSNRPAA